MTLRFGAMVFPRSLGTTRAVARLAEERGFAWFGLADSPAVYQDVFVHLADAAHVTERIALGPMATHVVVRHPIVLANQLATLQDLSGGRMAAVIATGNSGARGLGLRPSKLAELEAAIGFLHDYWAGEGGTWGSSVVPASGIARPATPIVVAGDGPRTLALGARAADGVLYSGSLDPTTFAARVAGVRAAAGTARTPLPWAAGPAPQVWVAAAASVAADPSAARAELGETLTAIANRALRGDDLLERGIPERLHADVAAMRDNYDYAGHATFDRPRNAATVSDALAEHLLRTFCLIGSADEWAATLHRLEHGGLDGFTIIVNQEDEVGTLARIADRLEGLGLLVPG
jgi:5,10-methylenetetrahydromethanopterin reductase